MKVRLKLKQRQIEDGQRPVGFDHAIYRLVERLPARTVRSVATEADEDAADQIWGSTPDYNALSNHLERVRRSRLGYDVAEQDAPDEVDDGEAIPPTTKRRRPLFPDAPMSWDDVAE